MSPAAVTWKPETLDLRFADFTPTDQASLAADCLPVSDPDKGSGYVRGRTLETGRLVL